MDGFKDRMSGRFERNGQGMSAPSGLVGRTLERPVRSAVTEGPSLEAINDVINKSNQEQIDVLAEYFDEAKADRMESERAIIEALSSRVEEIVSSSVSQNELGSADVYSREMSEPEPPVTVVAEPAAPSIDPEVFSRLERLAGQNAEEISDNGEMLQRSIEYLRANSELLSEIKGNVEVIRENQQSGEASVAVAPTMVPEPVIPELSIDITQEKEEILSAVGDNRALLNMIRQDVLNGFAQHEEPEEDEEPEEEKPELLSKELGEKHFQSLEELVHSECVKVFKNIKKTFEEENVKTVKEVEKTVSSMRLFLIASLGLNVVAVVILVLQFLGIF